MKRFLNSIRIQYYLKMIVLLSICLSGLIIALVAVYCMRKKTTGLNSIELNEKLVKYQCEEGCEVCSELHY